MVTWEQSVTSCIWFAKLDDDTKPDMDRPEFISEIQCSNCKLWSVNFAYHIKYKYCPHCGERMNNE